MKVRIFNENLKTSTPFTISRGTSTSYDRNFVELTWKKEKGLGEAACSSYYGETAKTVPVALDILKDSLPPDPFTREYAYDRWKNVLGGNMSAKAALDMASFDLAGKATGLPVYALLGLYRPDRMLTSITVSIASPEEMAKQAKKWNAHCIKVKMAGDGLDMDRLAAIRQALPSAILRIDANCAWNPAQTVQYARILSQLGIEMIEQPIPPGDNNALAWLRNTVDIPIFADESVRVSQDIPSLVGAVDGINIKLAKCGGIGEALNMIRIAKALGLSTMLGCMVESSVGISAALHLSTLVDYLDLDGHLLLANDPYCGIDYEKGGYLSLKSQPGLGIMQTENKQKDESKTRKNR